MAATILVAEDQADTRDLLILDLMMPGLDGLEVCKALRARARNTPILMLTAKSTGLDRVLGLELGADDHVTKPIRVDALVEAPLGLPAQPQRCRHQRLDFASRYG